MRNRAILLTKLGFVVSIFSLMAYAGNDLSEFRSKTHDIYEAITIPSKISLDGKVRDWADVEAFSSVEFPKEDGSMTVFEEHGGGTWTGVDDQTVAFKIVWDTQAVYLGIIVTDDDHQNATASGWNGDAAQIIVEPTGERKPENDHFRYNFALGNDGTLTVNNEKAAGGGLKEDHVAITRDGQTTIYEIKFPSSEFGIAKFEDGMSLGLGICVNDGDGPNQLGQRGWGGWYTHSAVFGKNPENTGLVKLISAKTAIEMEGKLSTTWAEIKN